MLSAYKRWISIKLDQAVLWLLSALWSMLPSYWWRVAGSPLLEYGLYGSSPLTSGGREKSSLERLLKQTRFYSAYGIRSSLSLRLTSECGVFTQEEAKGQTWRAEAQTLQINILQLDVSEFKRLGRWKLNSQLMQIKGAVNLNSAHDPSFSFQWYRTLISNWIPFQQTA